MKLCIQSQGFKSNFFEMITLVAVDSDPCKDIIVINNVVKYNKMGWRD